MSLEQLKNIVILVSAGISTVGIPMLIGLIWKYHETQVKALQMFTFKEVEQQISAMENTYIRVNKRLREYVAELEKQMPNEVPSEIENRIELLRSAQKELSHMGFVLDDDNKEFDLARRLHALSNREAMHNVQKLLNTLVRYEETVKKKISEGKGQALLDGEK
ncbi:MAG: hypothetical protein JOZ96_21235 [Acidobacteria bacterium]|nr:hypothetical protein [Acidobacteriota bacterium]